MLVSMLVSDDEAFLLPLLKKKNLVLTDSSHEFLPWILRVSSKRH